MEMAGGPLSFLRPPKKKRRAATPATTEKTPPGKNRRGRGISPRKNNATIQEITAPHLHTSRLWVTEWGPLQGAPHDMTRMICPTLRGIPQEGSASDLTTHGAFSCLLNPNSAPS